MKKDKTLLILAGGMGSRFANKTNEVKQITPIGPNDEFLIDYSIYDAKEAGFNKVVFVIQGAHKKIFKETIGNRIANQIKVEYAIQDIKDIPDGYEIPQTYDEQNDKTVIRNKPWGTSHAILAAKSYINEPFIIINADDYYGADAYKRAADFLDYNNDENRYSVIGYQVDKTLSENGKVKRGVCLSENGELTDLIESNIGKVDGKIVATPLDDSKEEMILNTDSLVSMNLLCFMPSIFQHITDRFPKFLDENLKSNPMGCEFLIPDLLGELRKEGIVHVSLLGTTSKWFGMTYYQDKEYVVDEIKQMIINGEYPENLWGKTKIK